MLYTTKKKGSRTLPASAPARDAILFKRPPGSVARVSGTRRVTMQGCRLVLGGWVGLSQYRLSNEQVWADRHHAHACECRPGTAPFPAAQCELSSRLPVSWQIFYFLGLHGANECLGILPGLSEDRGRAVNARDRFGCTPLHYVCLPTKGRSECSFDRP